MEESKKKQLKAFGKAMLYVLGIGISLCAGLVLGKCSADSANKNQISVRAEAPEIDFSSAHNYLEDAVEYQNLDMGFSSLEIMTLTRIEGIQPRAYSLDLSLLPRGLYYIYLPAVDDSGSFVFGGCQSGLVGYFDYYNRNGGTASIDAGSTTFNAFYWVDLGQSFTRQLYLTDDYAWSHVFFRCLSSVVPKLVFANAIDVPSSEVITFSKQNWFPFQLLGTNNSPVVRGPTWSNIGAQENVVLDNIVFRSNNTIFTSIILRFSPLGIYGSEASSMNYPTTYGYYTSDMEQIWVEKVNTHDLWYLSQVDYISYDNVQYVVGHQRRKLYDDGSVGAVTQFFDWVSSAYSTIEMIDWSDSINNNVSTGLMSSYDWIKAVASSVTSTPDVYLGGMSPFTLLGDAFHSLDSLLGIHILPMISIGTLIFTPLILLVIMAIIKILNK